MEGLKVVKVLQDMKSVVGKPMEHLNKLPEQHLKSTAKTINWNDFNYPPLLRVIHYDPTELPCDAGRIVTCLSALPWLVAVTCFLNLVDSCIIVATSSAPYNWIVQSVLNAILLPGLAFLAFYAGYCGLAEDDTTFLGRFTWGQIVLIAACVFLSIVPFGCANGLLKLAVLGKYVSNAPAPLFVAAILVESALWLSCAGTAACGFFALKRYDRHNDAGMMGTRV
jgi:hypothetical protein